MKVDEPSNKIKFKKKNIIKTYRIKLKYKENN